MDFETKDLETIKNTVSSQIAPRWLFFLGSIAVLAAIVAFAGAANLWFYLIIQSIVTASVRAGGGKPVSERAVQRLAGAVLALVAYKHGGPVDLQLFRLDEEPAERGGPNQ